jgi:hypothetical protein
MYRLNLTDRTLLLALAGTAQLSMSHSGNSTADAWLRVNVLHTQPTVLTQSLTDGRVNAPFGPFDSSLPVVETYKP